MYNPYETYEKQYLRVLQNLFVNGVDIKNERTGEVCRTLPNVTFAMNYSDGEVPVLSTKPSYPVSALAEIIGYLRRYTNAQDFADVGSKTWFANANLTDAWLKNPKRKGTNDLGTVYGAAMPESERDQLFLDLIAHNDHRGLMLNFWRPQAFDNAALRPCMYNHQFTIIDDTLHIMSHQRSGDMLLGHPFNALQSYFLLKFMAEGTGLKMGTSLMTVANAHIYESHFDAVKEQLSRVVTSVENVSIDINKEVYDNPFDLLAEGIHARDYFTMSGYLRPAKLESDTVMIP